MKIRNPLLLVAVASIIVSFVSCTSIKLSNSMSVSQLRIIYQQSEEARIQELESQENGEKDSDIIENEKQKLIVFKEITCKMAERLCATACEEINQCLKGVRPTTVCQPGSSCPFFLPDFITRTNPQYFGNKLSIKVRPVNSKTQKVSEISLNKTNLRKAYLKNILAKRVRGLKPDAKYDIIVEETLPDNTKETFTVKNISFVIKK